MTAYLSITNYDRINLQIYIDQIKERYPKIKGISFFQGGKYSTKKLDDAKIVIVAIPENKTVGKGVWSEIRHARQTGKLVFGLHKKFLHFPMTIEKISNPKDWTEFAIIITNYDNIMPSDYFMQLEAPPKSKELNKKLLLL